MAEGIQTNNSDRKGQIKIYGNDRLSDRVNIFQKQVEKHESKQKTNPFSSTFEKDSTTSTGMSKSDPRYGRPEEGSKTDLRGKKASSHIGKEVVELCNLIKEYGEPQEDGTVGITFGELFQMYTVISNKVVGILLRARKHKLVHFDGEMLYQRRDEEKVITLFPWNNDDGDRAE